MTTKRLAQISINWPALLERAPPQQLSMIQGFKSKIDNYGRKLNALPEKPPAIDWAYYKSRISVPGMVESFQKKYETLSIPYPTDTLTAKVLEKEQVQMKKVAEFIKTVDKDIKEIMDLLERDRNTLPFSEMTMEDFQEAYPETAVNTFTRPSHWPHAKDDIEEAEYYRKTGKIPEHLVVHNCH